MMYNIRIAQILLLLLCQTFVFSQKGDSTGHDALNKLNLIASRLKLKPYEKDTLRNKLAIVDQLYLATNDSLKYVKSKNWLDSFLLKKIDEKKLIQVLEMVAVLPPEISFSIRNDVDLSTVENYEVPRDLLKTISAIKNASKKEVYSTKKIGTVEKNTYVFIKDILGKDAIRIDTRFGTLLPDISYGSYFKSETALMAIWTPAIGGSENTPDIKPFLDHINLDNFLAYAESEFSNNVPPEIELPQLNKKFVAYPTKQKHLNNQGQDELFKRLSRPYFNLEEDWAIITIATIHKKGTSANTLYIYRKVESNWVLYHVLKLNAI